MKITLSELELSQRAITQFFLLPKKNLKMIKQNFKIIKIINEGFEEIKNCRKNLSETKMKEPEKDKAFREYIEKNCITFEMPLKFTMEKFFKEYFDGDKNHGLTEISLTDFERLGFIHPEKEEKKEIEPAK